MDTNTTDQGTNGEGEKPKRNRRTPEQKKAAAEKALASAKTDIRRRETREKVIVGALGINHAMRRQESAARLVAFLDHECKSDLDRNAISNLLERLRDRAQRSDPAEAPAQGGEQNHG